MTRCRLGVEMINDENYHPPPNWGKDQVSKFFEIAEKNSQATFIKMSPDYQRIVFFDELFRLGIDCASHSKYWFQNFFFLKSHSAYLGAARFATSTQNSELPMVLRGTLEWSLYGHFFQYFPDLIETWLNLNELRENDPDIVYKFSRKRLLFCLQEKSPSLGQKAEKLYGHLIDLGAHPNELSLSKSIKIEEASSDVSISNLYLSSNPDAIKWSLLTTSKVGYCCLRIWELLFKKRFEIMGISDKLDRCEIK